MINSIDYNIIINVIVGIASAGASIFIGWYVHQRQVNIAAIKEHFEDLKANVVEPMLSFLEYGSGRVRAFDKISADGELDTYRVHSVETPTDRDATIKRFDDLLGEDLVKNHYPVVRKLWDEIAELNQTIAQKDASLDNLFAGEIKNRLDSSNINYINQLTVRVYNIIFLGDFARALKRILVENDPFSNEYLEHNTSSNSLSLYGQQICNFDTNINSNDIVKAVTEICLYVSENDIVRKEVGDYKHLLKKREARFTELKSNLKTIRYITALRIERKYLFRSKCRFIKKL